MSRMCDWSSISADQVASSVTPKKRDELYVTEKVSGALSSTTRPMRTSTQQQISLPKFLARFLPNVIWMSRKNEWELLREYMRQNRKCRKNYIYSLVDGSSSGMCLFNPASENCDACDELLDTINPNVMPYVSSQAFPSRNSFPQPHVGALTNELSSPRSYLSEVQTLLP